MTGFPGKWPWKNGSLTETFLRPVTFEPTTTGPGVISRIRSTRRNG